MCILLKFAYILLLVTLAVKVLIADKPSGFIACRNLLRGEKTSPTFGLTFRVFAMQGPAGAGPGVLAPASRSDIVICDLIVIKFQTDL